MTRNIHNDTKAILSNPDLQTFHLITFYFTSTFRLTEHQHNITVNLGSGDETFLASGRLATAGDAAETLELSNPTISITLTGANEADIALALTEDFTDKRILIRRGFFDNSGSTADSNIIADPFILFDGRVSSFSIVDDPQGGESAVTWNITSHWADWEKVKGRKCTNQSAQGDVDPATGNKIFPNEDGFTHVYDQIGSKTWGRIRS